MPNRLRDGVLFERAEQSLEQHRLPERGQFALIHCQAGSASGVWLHYLASDDERTEYLCGCHEVPSW